MPHQDPLAALRVSHPHLAEEFAAFQGIHQVLEWMKRRDLTRTAVDIVGMDEFEYDFLVQSGPGEWLAFGVT